MLVSGRIGGDSALDRSDLVNSEIASFSGVDKGLRHLETALGFNLNLIHLQSILDVLV
jgi:hypothetical protein